MNTKSIVTGIVAVVICTVLAVTVMIPILSDSGSNVNHIGQNENYQYTATNKIGDYTYSKDSDGKFTVNDEVLVTKTGQYIVSITDKTYSVFQTSNGTTLYRDVNYSTINNAPTLEYNSDGSWVATASNDTTSTGSGITRGFYPINGGEWGVYTNNVSFNVDKGQKVYFGVGAFFSATDGDSVSHPIMAMFSMIDGVVTTEYAYLYDTTTQVWSDVKNSTTATIRGTWTDNGLYGTYEHTDFTIAITGYTLDGSVGNSHLGMYAPITYHYQTSTDNSITSMLAVVPILVIVGIVVATVSLFVTKRD